MNVVILPLASLTANAGAKPWIALNELATDEYAVAMRDGVAFLPAVVFSDGRLLRRRVPPLRAGGQARAGCTKRVGAKA